MLAILFLAAAGFMMIVLILLAVVVAGIKQEPPTQELTSRPPSAVTAWVRRLLGVHVRKPDQPPVSNQDRKEPCLAVRDPHHWPRGSAE
jgi:hypothetical protein